MKIFIKISCVCLWIVCVAISANAEGGGNRSKDTHGHITDHGINRRVNSIKGYIGVQGELSAVVKSVQVPVVPTSPSYANIVANIYRDKPTFYVGSYGVEKAEAEVDAGLQYFSEGDYGGDHYLSGWGPFINAKKYLMTPKYCLGHHWYGYRGKISQSISDPSSKTYAYTLIYKVDPDTGFVNLSVDTNGDTNLYSGDKTKTKVSNVSFNWVLDPPPDPLNINDKTLYPLAGQGKLVYQPDDIDEIGVKRVIGITQGAAPGQSQDNFPYALDGSITTAKYANGQVFKNGATSWTDWTPSIVNQSATGYDVDEDAKDAQWNKKDTLASQYILTFPNIQDTYKVKQADGTYKTFTLNGGDGAKDARLAVSSSNPSDLLEENNKSRYVEETVKISLRSATKITGTASTVRGANQ